MKKTVLMVAALLCTFACFAQVVDFEDLTLEPNSSWNGSDGTGQFTSSYLTMTTTIIIVRGRVLPTLMAPMRKLTIIAIYQVASVTVMAILQTM